MSEPCDHAKADTETEAVTRCQTCGAVNVEFVGWVAGQSLVDLRKAVAAWRRSPAVHVRGESHALADVLMNNPSAALVFRKAIAVVDATQDDERYPRGGGQDAQG